METTNAPLWNDWAGLAPDLAYWSKVYYSNLAHGNKYESARLLADHEFVLKEQSLGIGGEKPKPYDPRVTPYFLLRA